MKRIVLVVVTAVLAAAVFALGCGKEPFSGGPSASSNMVRIKFWHIQVSGAARKVVDAAVGRYELKHTNIAVDAVPVKNDNFKLRIEQALAAGTAPDVFHTWGGGMLRSYVREGQVADLTKLAQSDNVTSRMLPAAMKFATVDGKLYAVPMDMSVVVMWYNRDIFEKNKIEPPTTFDALLAACRKLRAAGVTPIALGNRDRWPGAFYYDYLATRIGGTQPFADAENRTIGATFEAPCFVEAGRRLQELVRAEAFNPGADSLTYDDARELFVQEKAAMMLMGTWFISDLRSEPSALLDKVDCFAFPAVAGGKGDPKIVLGGINAAYAVSAHTIHENQAFGLLVELTSDVTEAQWGATGRIPALKDALQNGMIDPTTRKAAEMLFDAPDVQNYYDQALAPALAELHKELTQYLIAGTKTPEEAAQIMETRAAELAAKTPTAPAK